MDDFLTNYVESQFIGAGWETNWSSASNQKITSRIALNETAETSLTANETGIRKLAMVAATISDLLSGPLGEEARNVLYDRSLTLVGEAIADIAGAQAEAGIVENRVSDASARISSQVDLFKTLIKDSEGIDPYEAATRVNDLRAQLDASYALTARLQQLSLLNYLR